MSTWTQTSEGYVHIIMDIYILYPKYGVRGWSPPARRGARTFQGLHSICATLDTYDFPLNFLMNWQCKLKNFLFLHEN
jgi:hypothetical protein